MSASRIEWSCPMGPNLPREEDTKRFVISRIRNRWFTVGDETCDISKSQIAHQIFRIRNRKSPVTFSLGRVRGWDYRHSIRGEILDRLSYSNQRYIYRSRKLNFLLRPYYFVESVFNSNFFAINPISMISELFEDGSVFFKMHSISSKSDRW